MATDPVADKSGFLRMYMSGHPDTLVAYAKWYGKIQEPISSAEMASIDSKSMTLRCKLKNGGTKDVRVAIEPPLSGYDDVKPRLLEMKALSQEGLGMIKTPQITSLYVPWVSAFKTLLFVASLAYLAYPPTDKSSLLYLPFHLTYAYISPYIPSSVSPYLSAIPYYTFWSAVVAHVFESMYTASLCQRHKTGLVLGTAYVALTLVFGFPIWTELRKRIQSARIDSVMKVE